jgi:hypothetical protein
MEPLDGPHSELEVECYSGFRDCEKPLRFRISGAVFEIESILAEWRTPEEHCFRVRTAAGGCVLHHHLQTDSWTIEPCLPRFTQP